MDAISIILLLVALNAVVIVFFLAKTKAGSAVSVGDVSKPQFANPPFMITLAMLVLVAMVVYRVLWSDPPFSNDVQIMVITLVVGGLAEIRKYWLNSTSDSEKKNDTINTLATKSGTGNGDKPLKVDVVGTPGDPPPATEEAKP